MSDDARAATAKVLPACPARPEAVWDNLPIQPERWEDGNPQRAEYFAALGLNPDGSQREDSPPAMPAPPGA